MAAGVVSEMKRKRSIRDLDLSGQRVLLRADLNVPLNDGAVADDSRIRAVAPTIEMLLEQGAAVVVCSHLGRPGGSVHEALRLGPVAERLAACLRHPVRMAPDGLGRPVQNLAGALQPGEVLMLENLRFHRGEEANAARFAARLARLADVYVNDAFGTAHRAHASTEGVAHLLPSAAGLLLQRELEQLSGAVGVRGQKSGVVSGGAKVSDKLPLLSALAASAQCLCIGGAMANTFLLAQGVAVGASLAEPEILEAARDVLASAQRSGCAVYLPVDGVIARGPTQPPRARPVVLANEPIPDGWMLLDVGPRTVETFKDALAGMDVVVWNGPLGLFEHEAFAGATRALARALADASARTIVCGGETVQAVRDSGLAAQFTHLSTGGGAALALLEGRDLPAIAALPDVG